VQLRNSRRLSDSARVALAAIRLFNGTASLVAPATMGRKLGVDPEQNRAALYVLRLFGVRTVLIGADLLASDPAVRARALRVAVLVHASDVAAAVIAGARRQLPPRAAATAAVISAGNVGLAVLARRERAPRRR
jgi:hypothetical protein